MQASIRAAIVGTAGVPAAYGGFETLADNLARYTGTAAERVELTIYCSSVGQAVRYERFENATLAYINVKPNGVSSMLYDALSIFHAIRSGHDTILLLGVSGALCLPFARTFTRRRIVTNIDGIEWRRAKWNWLARLVLRASEWAAVRFSHVVIADNGAIADYVEKTYRAKCEVIAYGGDHALQPELGAGDLSPFGQDYALALCRIEPENNVEMILKGWQSMQSRLVFVGNWKNSAYGRDLAERFGNSRNIEIVDPIYDAADLKRLRSGASLYLHGHSAGGTNPSLVEMMHFGIPVLAYDCVFNRYTTEDKALFFRSPEELRQLATDLDVARGEQVGQDMVAIAKARYTWAEVGQSYFKLLMLAQAVK